MHRPIVLLTALIAALWLPVAGDLRAAADAGIGAVSSYGIVPTAAPPNRQAPVKALAKGVFLIASERLREPNFSQSVVLLLEYDSTGALGLIINRPSHVSLASALPEVAALAGRSDVLYVGGPVGRNQLFLLIRGASRPTDANPVVDEIYSSISLETLRAVLGEEKAEFHAHAGYAGWGPGQLDAEVMRGDWYVTPADVVTMFDQPADDVWPALIRKNSGFWVRRAIDRAERRSSSAHSVVLPIKVQLLERTVKRHFQFKPDRLTANVTVLDVLR